MGNLRKEKNTIVENSLALRISSMGIKKSYDEICKVLLSNRQILAWILQSCVEEFSGCSIQEIAEKYIEESMQKRKFLHPDEQGEFVCGMNGEDVSMTEGKIFFDIRFTAVAPVNTKWVRLLINVEAQNEFYPGYPLIKRGIYYGSRMISSQHGVVFCKSHYEKIQKAYSIWVCTNPPRYLRNTIAQYAIQEAALVGEAFGKREDYDLMNVIMICLGTPEDKNYTGILKLLEVLLSDRRLPEQKKQILREEFGIVLTREMEEEVMSMCNLSQGIYERGLNDGWGKGLSEGLSEGMNKGLNEGRREVVSLFINNLRKATGWSTEKCTQLLGISSEWKSMYIDTSEHTEKA